MLQFLFSGQGLGVLLVSAGMLTFEIGLSRLFAVQQFHHFAFLVISLAVMGLAASGTLLALAPRRPALPSLCLAYAGAVLAAYAVINWLPFDSYSIAWDARQAFILLLYFLAACAPFVFAGWAVGAVMLEAGERVHHPYAANLAGSAIGCLLALVGIGLAGAEGSLLLAACAGLLAAAAFSTRRVPRLALAALACGIGILALRLPEPLQLSLSPYKPLSQAVLLPGARHTLSLHSPAARVDVVETGSLHAFPGLSLNAAVSLPEQAALFLDGDGPFPITSLSPADPLAAQLASHLPAALGYRLRPRAQALVLQAGAGLPVQLALAAGAGRVEWPVEEPLVVDALRGRYAEFSRGLLQDPHLVVLDRSGRGALAAAGERYDVVEFALSEPFRPVAAGAFSLSEYYPLTWQALYDAYARLEPDGILLITRWLGSPPSESARAWATLLFAMQQHGVQDPSSSLLAYRSMRTATLLAGRRPFSAGELAEARAFLQENGFDPIWLPDLRPEELNRHNRLPRDVYHELYAELLQRPEQALSNYEFNLRPPSDSRPYFYHYFRWRQTPQVLAALGTQWLPFGGSGYLVLLALLAVIVVLAALLVLAVLRGPGVPAGFRGQLLAYFGLLGAGYLWVEIPLIQRLTLLLDRPAVALAVVLFTVLMASGVGSLLSWRVPLRPALLALAGLLAVELPLLPGLVQLGLPWPLPARVLLAAALAAPPGLLMGIPFAAGLRRVQRGVPGSTAWAWAINGAASGISGVLAAILALDWGFGATFGLGGLAYLGAWLASRGSAFRTPRTTRT